MAQPVGDQYWYYKVLGLHCDGANNSTTFTDVKGKTVTANGNAKISTAQYPSITGKSSSAILDGAGDYLSIPDSADWNFGSGDFTIRFLCRPTSTSADQEILAQRKSADGNNFWFIRRTSAEKLRVYGKAGGSIITDVLSTGTLTVDSWQLVEIVRTSGSVKISIAGTFGTAVTTDGSGSWPDVAHVVYVGVGDDTFGAGNFYNGYLSEIEIYKGVALHTADFTPSSDPFPDTYVRISGTTKDAGGSFASRLVRVYRRDTGELVEQTVSDETTGAYSVTAADSGKTTPLKHIAIMHTNETGVYVPWRVLGLHCDGANTSTTFTDVKGKTVTANGNAQISTAQYPALTGKTSSAIFDGTGDYLSSAASSDFNFGTGDFTIRCMFYLAADSSVDGNGTRYARLFCLTNTTTSFECDLEIIGDASTTGIGVSFYSSVNGAFSRTITVTKNVWHDVEVSRSGTSLRLFLDGTQLGATITNSASWGSSTYGAYVGGAPFGSNYYFYFNGYISEVEVYKGVALHTADFTPLTVPFYDKIGTATDNAIIFDDITPY